MEKLASTTRSIVDRFSAHLNKNQSQDERALSAFSPPIFSPKSTEKEVKETQLESQTRAVYDLGKLLRLKPVQMDKYGHVLDHKSNLYWRHQTVQSFLWMQLNKEKDNPGLNRESLAQIVANSFNRWAYTGRKIIQWERCLVKHCTILGKKAGKYTYVESWMEDENLIFFEKEWSKKS